MSTTRTAEFTGRHMLAIMLVFFGLIIGVNVTMAVFASTSWTGLVVKNAYVASQEFNAKAAEARAQAALGLTAMLTIADGTIAYRLIDASVALCRSPAPPPASIVQYRRARTRCCRLSLDRTDRLRPGMRPVTASGSWKSSQTLGSRMHGEKRAAS